MGKLTKHELAAVIAADMDRYIYQYNIKKLKFLPDDRLAQVELMTVDIENDDVERYLKELKKLQRKSEKQEVRVEASKLIRRLAVCAGVKD